jgi:hypothetical protein
MSKKNCCTLASKNLDEMNMEGIGIDGFRRKYSLTLTGPSSSAAVLAASCCRPVLTLMISLSHFYVRRTFTVLFFPHRAVFRSTTD